MIERYRKALLGLSDPIERSNADGVALYQTLVAPARELIRPGSTVMILDDGALSQLNFETLIASEPAPHYFIEDATLISAPSLQMLASAKPVAREGKSLLLVGDAISPNPDYPELPKAATEMKQIEQHFPSQDETVFARERATAAPILPARHNNLPISILLLTASPAALTRWTRRLFFRAPLRKKIRSSSTRGTS